VCSSDLEKAEALAVRMNELMWVETEAGGFYAGLRFVHGSASLADEYVTDSSGSSPDPMCTISSLLPLYAGVPQGDRAAKLAAMIADPAHFWSAAGVRTMPASSPLFNQSPRCLIYDGASSRGTVSNWQGPAWVLTNYYVAQGLRDAGRADLADEVCSRTVSTLSADLGKAGVLHENYDDGGEGLWPPHSYSGAGFVSWNVLAINMLSTLSG